MLVLSRKLREKIQIGEDVTITILRVKGNSVRVGIEAPRSVKVVRGELPREVEPTPSDSPQGLAQSKPKGSALQRPSFDANLSVFVSNPTDDQVIEIRNDGPVQVYREPGADCETDGLTERCEELSSGASGMLRPPSSRFNNDSAAQSGSQVNMQSSESLPSGQNRLRQIADSIAKLNH